jgi:hypothetical protein
MNTIPPTAAQPPPLEPPLPDRLDFKTLFETILRQPHALINRIDMGCHGAVGRFITICIGSFLLFGFVIGCFAKHEQLWAAPLKITAGLLFASVICFPSLYIFATLSGSKITIAQMATYFAGALSLAGILLLGFAPAIWIFAESTDSLGFMGVLAIITWIITILFALRFLNTVAGATGGHKKTPLRLWGIIFLLVTLQLTTSLRPILGRSDELFTQEKKFFLQHWYTGLDESLPDITPNTSSPDENPY